MTAAAWLQIAALVGLLLLGTRLLGPYLASVYGGGVAHGDRVFLPLERLIYRVGGVAPEQEQSWVVYARSVITFSLVSVLGLYALERLQGWLPLNPSSVESVPPVLAFNTAVSFVTNTNWQNYGGESTMSDLVQMTGLTVQNFVSAAVGMAVAVALIRGFTRHRAETIGNFWVDLTRGVTRVLLPLALVLARPLARWKWLDTRRLVQVAAAALVVIVFLKGASGYWPVDRDARQMASQIRAAVDLTDVDEIVFIDMRAFFGLSLYLDLEAESVRIGVERPHSRWVPTEQDLCSELAEKERSLFAVKRTRAPRFPAAVADCGLLEAEEMGSFHGDGNELVLFAVRPTGSDTHGVEEPAR